VYRLLLSASSERRFSRGLDPSFQVPGLRQWKGNAFWIRARETQWYLTLGKFVVPPESKRSFLFGRIECYRERYHREKKARRLALRPNILGKIEIFHGTDDIGNGRNGKDSIDNQVEGRK
jgi:hypothetical protein